MKSYTDLEQSKKLAEILPIKSADMTWEQVTNALTKDFTWKPTMGLDKAIADNLFSYRNGYVLPCYSLAALLDYIKDKCGYFELVYINSTNVYRLSTNIYDVHNKELVDACYEMVLKLHEQKLL